MRRTFFSLFTELSSRKWVSQLTGKFAKTRISKHLIHKFIKTYGIPAHEAEKALEEYASLNDFFTRRLKPGLRPIDTELNTLTSPVDALITGIGEITDGHLLNVKGQDYKVEELLNRSPRVVNYTHGFYMVLYLSPSDYHRIHSPITGKIIETEHILGKVYPVNDHGLRYIRRTLSRNERLITYIQHELGEVAVTKVGAMNVSSIRYVEPLPNTITKGQELAYFEFGSTVVLLMESGTFTPRNDLMTNRKVKMGETIGYIHKSK